MTYMLIAGIAGFGYLLPEFLLFFSTRPITIPVTMNAWSAACSGLIAAGVFLK